MACFHIRWSESGLDGDCQRTQAEARTRAQELSKPFETFSIERFQDGNGTELCPSLRAVPRRMEPREQELNAPERSVGDTQLDAGNAIGAAGDAATNRVICGPIRVLVVDNFAAWRRYLSAALGKQPELQIVGEAADGLEAVQKAKELQPELILLDIGLPNLNGIEASRKIREVSPASKILFVSQYCTTDVAEAAMSTGAAGYVVKTDAGRDLSAAVDAVLNGEQFRSASLAGERRSAKRRAGGRASVKGVQRTL
jgi:DNA-binding NarL/FixJ family response regulator